LPKTRRASLKDTEISARMMYENQDKY